MHSSNLFRDQVGTLTGWFRSWNECEQTVALYSLLLKVAPAQAKFLLQVLEHSVADCAEVQQLECQANNSVYIGSLCSESKEYAVSRLLACLPLLRAGNTAAKAEYLRIIPKVLAHSIDRRCHLEESRQLVSYSLIHPAIGGSERELLTQWLSFLPPEGDAAAAAEPVNGGYVSAPPPPPATAPGPARVNGWRDEDAAAAAAAAAAGKSAGGRAITSTASRGGGGVSCNGMLPMRNEHLQLHATHSGPAGFTAMPGGNAHRKLARSASITPPTNSSAGSTNVSDWLNCCLDDGGVGGMRQGHAPISPQSSGASSSGSGSETHGDEALLGGGAGRYLRNTFLEEGSGMRDVPIWLKSLRLHKYASLFQQMTYEDMMQLTEVWLESKLVTKGARHKIILNVARLQKRQSVLRSLEKEIMEAGNIKQALTEIKTLMNMPLKAFAPLAPPPPPPPVPPCAIDNGGGGGRDELSSSPPFGEALEGDLIAPGDIPGQITRVLGKLCTQLLVSMRPDDTCFSIYMQLLDKCYMHEAFTNEQKKKLLSWRQQVQKIWHMAPVRYNLERQRKSLYAGGVAHRALRGQPPPTSLPLHQLKAADQTTWTFGPGGGGGPAAGLTGSGCRGPGGLGLPLTNSLFNSVAAATMPPFDYLPRQLAAYDIPTKQPIGRTHSAPSQSNPLSVPLSTRTDFNETEPEMNARLDSLCLSMTEHALGSFDSPDRGSTF